MEKYDIIIIGGGASGIMAARTLSQSGMRVLILEARTRLGGRIHTLNNFAVPLEAGAEFVHGDLPVTLSLLKEAGIPFYPLEGKIMQFRNNRLISGENFMDISPQLVQRLQELREDMGVEQFLDTYFSGDQHVDMRNSILGFVQGYDAADTKRASAFSLRDELLAEEEATQYKVAGGYQRMIAFLEKQSLEQGVHIRTSTAVREIRWEPGHAVLTDRNGASWEAAKVLITVPLGLLTGGQEASENISFIPPIPEKQRALEEMGYGFVIKILLQFKIPFWEMAQGGKAVWENTFFIFSEAFVPTWWTQLPETDRVLTGWLAGPRAGEMKHEAPDIILEEGLASLAGIFGCAKETLVAQLEKYEVVNWAADPFTRGAYSYLTPETTKARKIVAAPADATLFFAGEAFYEGKEIGTVEAALDSGMKVAYEILRLVKSV